MSRNAEGEHTFHLTTYTHEVVVEGTRLAFAESLSEAKVVARAISRVMPASQETRIYAAFATTPHSSYVTGWKVK